jgi:hypothetical protein
MYTRHLTCPTSSISSPQPNVESLCPLWSLPLPSNPREHQATAGYCGALPQSPHSGTWGRRIEFREKERDANYILGRDQNSNFEVWFLLSGIRFASFKSPKNHKLNHHQLGHRRFWSFMTMSLDVGFYSPLCQMPTRSIRPSTLENFLEMFPCWFPSLHFPQVSFLELQLFRHHTSANFLFSLVALYVFVFLQRFSHVTRWIESLKNMMKS